MRHTLKWSFFVGTAAAGIVLALMKLLQPIRYEHLVVFGYAFVGSSVIAGYVAHKNLEKRNVGKANTVVKANGGKMEEQDIAVRRIPINEKVSDMQEKEAEEYFVPASKLLAETDEFENNAFDAGGNMVAAKSTPENGTDKGQHHAAENFLEEIEKEEIEKATGEFNNDAEFSEKTNHGLLQQKCLLKFKDRQAKIFTNDGKTITGKFSGMDTHVVLENAQYDSEKKSLLMVSKDGIARMEIE